MILELLFMLDLWLDFKNVKHLKKYQKRINACGIASYKMKGLLRKKKYKQTLLIKLVDNKI